MARSSAHSGNQSSPTMVPTQAEDGKTRINVASPNTVMEVPSGEDSSGFGLSLFQPSSPVRLVALEKKSDRDPTSPTVLVDNSTVEELETRQTSGETTAQEEEPTKRVDIAGGEITPQASSAQSSIGILWTSFFDRCFVDCQAITCEPRDLSFFQNQDMEMDFLGLQEEKLEDKVPELLEILETGRSSKQKKRALDTFYTMTKQNTSENRVPLVCTTEWHSIPILSRCLTSDKFSEGDSRQICLILVNLTVPVENKIAMMMGPDRDVFLDSLWRVIFDLKANAYLCCVCLMNLSYLDDAKDVLLHYIATEERTEYKHGVVGNDEILFSAGDNDDDLNQLIAVQQRTPCLDNPKSLLRSLEAMLALYQPYCKDEQSSFEREAVRWSIGMFKNMTSDPERAAIVGQTVIPRLVLELLRDTTRPLHMWKEQSLEDMSLLMLLDFAKQPQACSGIWEDQDLAHCLDHIIGQGGIHDIRASAIAARFKTQSIHNTKKK